VSALKRKRPDARAIGADGYGNIATPCGGEDGAREIISQSRRCDDVVAALLAAAP